MKSADRFAITALLILILAVTVAFGASPDPTQMQSIDADSATPGAPAGMQIRDAWARATPEGAAEAVVYLKLQNSGAADRLIGIRSGVSEGASLHESRSSGAMVGMHPVPVLDIPAHTAIELAPGGLHVMLTGLHRGLKQGERFPLTLQFSEAGDREVDVVVADIGTLEHPNEHMHH